MRSLRDTRVGCISTRREPPEEDCEGMGRVAKGRRADRARHKCRVSFFFFFGRDGRTGCSFLLSFSFVDSSFSFCRAANGGKEI